MGRRKTKKLLPRLFLRCFAATVLALGVQSASARPALQIASVSPAELAPGGSQSLTITGSGFTKDCYVSFSSPAIRVLSTSFTDASHLGAKVTVGEKAAPGPVTLYVANAEGVSAQIGFSITAAPAGASVEPAPAAVENAAVPVFTSVEPASAPAGADTTIKVKGRNFAKGATVSFSNPGIEVLATTFSKATELTAKLRVASGAAAGACHLFVVNPDESEVEGSFSVTAASGGASSSSAKAQSKSAASAAQTFNVINLGDAISVLQKAGKPQGVLTLSAGNLQYDEQGKKVFSVPVGEVKEVASNVFFGIDTHTFHIILNSGATYNFIAASLSPQTTQSMVNSLQGALH